MKVMQWEYKYEWYSDGKEKHDISGKQGWEAVGMSDGRILYKRPAGIIDIQGKYEQEAEKASPDQVE